MSRCLVYLKLALLGRILPYWQFVPWLREHGLVVGLLFRELFSTRIRAFFGWDVIVSVVA